MLRLLSLVVLVCVIAAGLAEPATQNSCPTDVTKCTVSNLDIVPCPAKSRCVFRRGHTATIKFDFNPDFDASELETQVSWNGIPFASFDSNACAYATCPASKGVTQTYSYNLRLSKKLPPGIYDIKWKLWNKADATQLCCFITNIKIR